MRGNILTMMFLVVLSLSATGVVLSQDDLIGDPQRPDNAGHAAGQPGNMKRDVLAQLGLSPEQMQQIRKLNAERRPILNEAQRRMRMANKALDEAIYAEQVKEADIHARLKEFQLAQAEVANARFMNELAVRRILTPEQLVRFRELRQEFERGRRGFQNRRLPPGDRPFMRQRRRDRMNAPPDQDKTVRTPVTPDR